MDLAAGVADLHLHTVASDGTASVADRIDQANDRGLAAIAITDHDSISDALVGRVTTTAGVDVITGVEVRADVDGTKVELLGYFIDPDDRGLSALLERIRDHRRTRNREIIERLRAVADFDRSYTDLRATADGILGRPHIADALVETGVVDSVGAAFRQYLGADGEAFVPMDRIEASAVIAAIRDAGGVVSLAHPGRIRTDDIDHIVSSLVSSDLDAIEVPYPYDDAPSQGYADVTAADAAGIAERYELLRTGGSDCHGPDSGKYRIGDVRITRHRLDALRERAAERRPF